MPSFFIGIDPGSQGGFAVLDPEGNLVEVCDLPVLDGEPVPADVAALVEAIAPVADLYCVVETPFVNNVTARTSQAKQFLGYGMLLGVLGAMGVPHGRIGPQRWKYTVGLPMSGKLTYAEKKDNSRQLAAKWWPDAAGKFARKRDDGRAEAALIGEAGRYLYYNPDPAKEHE